MAKACTAQKRRLLEFFFGVLFAAVFFSAPPSFAAPPPCVGSAVAGTDKSNADVLAIDYPRINDLLVSADSHARLRELPALILRLNQSAAPEAASVSAHLQLALAKTQAEAKQLDAAMATLGRFALHNAQAPEAIFLLAELEEKNGRPASAIQWLRQLGELFPHDARAVQALLRAAVISADSNTVNDTQALQLLQQAVQQAEHELLVARHWQQRSLATDFLDAVNTEKLPASLWRLAHIALTDPAFASADSAQAETRRQLQCLTAQQDERLRLLQKNPILLADIANTVYMLDAQLPLARQELSAREAEFLESTKRWKTCKAGATENQNGCSAEKNRHDEQGRALTGWRNRVHDLEKKNAFLRGEQKAMPQRQQRDYVSSTKMAMALTDKRGAARTLMQLLLQQTLNRAVQDWEELAAQAHFQLAQAQDPRLKKAILRSIE